MTEKVSAGLMMPFGTATGYQGKYDEEILKFLPENYGKLALVKKGMPLECANHVVPGPKVINKGAPIIAVKWVVQNRMRLRDIFGVRFYCCEACQKDHAIQGRKYAAEAKRESDDLYAR